jgi:hypothetical protein
MVVMSKGLNEYLIEWDICVKKYGHMLKDREERIKDGLFEESLEWEKDMAEIIHKCEGLRQKILIFKSAEPVLWTESIEDQYLTLAEAEAQLTSKDQELMKRAENPSIYK